MQVRNLNGLIINESEFMNKINRLNTLLELKSKEYFLLKARCVNSHNESFWLDWDLSEGCDTITDLNGDIVDFDIAQFYASRLLNRPYAPELAL